MPNGSTTSLWVKPRTINKMKSLHKIICATTGLEIPSWNETLLSSRCCVKSARASSCLNYLSSQQKGGEQRAVRALGPSLATGLGQEEIWGQLRPAHGAAQSRGFAIPHEAGNLLSLIFVIVIIKYITRASSSRAKQDNLLKLCFKRHIIPPTKLIDLSEICMLSLLYGFQGSWMLL